MTIPSDFYKKFRLKTTLMAAGTGFLMGCFSIILIPPVIHPLIRFTLVPLGGIVAVLLNQWLVHGYFRGRMQGAFKYVYRESLLEPAIKSQISSARPSGGEVVLEFESIALFNDLMRQAENRTEETSFICYMAAAKVANSGSEDMNAIKALKLALLHKPNDVVANFRLARSFECIGSAKEAIEAYEAALQDSSIDSEEFREFITAQIQRVREQGPQRRPPIPGLIYQLM